MTPQHPVKQSTSTGLMADRREQHIRLTSLARQQMTDYLQKIG
jgi:hypothetical protein